MAKASSATSASKAQSTAEEPKKKATSQASKNAAESKTASKGATSKEKKTPSKKSTSAEASGSASSASRSKKTSTKSNTKGAESARVQEEQNIEVVHDLDELDNEETDHILDSQLTDLAPEVVQQEEVDQEDDDVKVGDLSDEALLEGIPEEELKSATEIVVPKVSSKAKTSRSRCSRQAPMPFR